MKRIFFFVLLLLAGATAFTCLHRQKKQIPIPTVIKTEDPKSFDQGLHIRVLDGTQVLTMSLHEYLSGVVSAEMPPDFPLQALKAQAIAARTFTLRQAESQKHPTADICTQANCCQGWQAETSSAAVQAVQETDGLVLTYEDKLIEATYFSCSGNRTEAALAVWGSDIPYLQSVESIGEEAAPRYCDEVCLSPEVFAQTLQNAYPQIDLAATHESWIEEVTYTKGGGIDKAVIGGVSISGTKLRQLFSLRSTDIAFQMQGEQIIITTYGFGHRVGMSQYGAKAMAEKNCNFEEILTHYYQNVQIQQLYMKKTPLPESEEVFILSISPW